MAFPTSVGNLPAYSLNGDLPSPGTFPALVRIVATDLVGPTAANKQAKSLERQNATMHDKINEMVAFADADTAAKVSKSGDTMSGQLILIYNGLKLLKGTGSFGGGMIFEKSASGTTLTQDVSVNVQANSFIVSTVGSGPSIGAFYFDLNTGQISNQHGDGTASGVSFSEIVSCAVAPTTANHLVNKTYADLKAPIASPALTGTPTAPTAVVATNTTQIATTAFARTLARLFRPKFYKANLTAGQTVAVGDGGTTQQLYVFNFSADFTVEGTTDGPGIYTPATGYMTLATGYIYEFEIVACVRNDGNDVLDTSAWGRLLVEDVTGSPVTITDHYCGTGTVADITTNSVVNTKGESRAVFRVDCTAGAKNIKVSFIRGNSLGSVLSLLGTSSVVNVGDAGSTSGVNHDGSSTPKTYVFIKAYAD